MSFISVFVGCEITMKIAFVATYFHVSFKKFVLNHLWLFHIGSLVPIFLALSTSELKNNTHIFFPSVLGHGKNLGSVRMKSVKHV